MDEEKNEQSAENEDEKVWQPPEILERGKIEALLFSDEPDPWGP